MFRRGVFYDVLFSTFAMDIAKMLIVICGALTVVPATEAVKWLIRSGRL
jgi:hypothetical protein